MNEFKIGDKVILIDNDARHDIISNFDKHPFYTITSMNKYYIRVNGSRSGWVYSCFDHYHCKDNLLPNELFEI